MKAQRMGKTGERRPRLSQLMPTGETVVLYGDRRLTVQGCRRILAYSPTVIRLQMKKRQLVIRGSDLICSCFSGGCTTLLGQIRQVEYEGGDGE